MSPLLLQTLPLLTPHLASVTLISARLLPLSLLCPLFGGASAPQPVRLSLVLSLALGLHFAGGLQAPSGLTLGWTFAALAGRECVLGVAMGLVAGLPFDAARMGGRFIDLFRGTSAEATLPLTGTKEAASGDGLYQLATAVAATGGGFPLVLGAVFRSFAVLPLGGAFATEGLALGLARLAVVALAGGLAIGAPIAGLSLAVDCLLGLVSRAAPQVNVQETGAPLKILGGGVVLWCGLGLISQRTLAAVAASGDQLAALLAGLP